MLLNLKVRGVQPLESSLEHDVGLEVRPGSGRRAAPHHRRGARIVGGDHVQGRVVRPGQLERPGEGDVSRIRPVGADDDRLEHDARSGGLDDQHVAGRAVRDLVRDASEYAPGALHASAAEHDQVRVGLGRDCNGILVDQVSTLTPDERFLGAALIQDFAESPLVRDFGILGSIGTIGLIVGMAAAGVVLRDAGAPRWAPAAFGVSGLLISGHPPPFGPIGLVLFAGLAFYLAEISAEPAAERPARRPPPAPFSRGERIFMIGVPLAWALLLVLHPTGEGEDFYPIVKDEVTPWMVVHLGTMLFVPLMAAVVLLLLRGITGTAATIGRVALLVFAVAYMAWEVLIGVGNGVLIDQVNQLGPGEVAVGASLVELYTDSGLVGTIELIGTGAWFVALAATGVALVRSRGVSVAVPILLILSAVPTAWHVVPFGQFGLALFIGAVLLVLRARASTPMAVPPAQPVSA